MHQHKGMQEQQQSAGFTKGIIAGSAQKQRISQPKMLIETESNRDCI
jgi:hypothetical protein